MDETFDIKDHSVTWVINFSNYTVRELAELAQLLYAYDTDIAKQIQEYLNDLAC